MVKFRGLLRGRASEYSSIVIGLCMLALLAQTVWFSMPVQDPSPRRFADFDAFYLAAQMVWSGEIEAAYDFSMFTRAQESFFGAPRFLPWAYPPQFNVLIAPLAILPYGAAYGLFTATTLIAYLLTLKRLAAEGFSLTLLVISPAILSTVLCGQNGFLTGTLIGLTCLALQERTVAAGLPLGLMIIKPHLGVAYGVYMLVTRRWTAVLVAVLTVAGTSALTTLLLGPEIWSAFLKGTGEARHFLEEGKYPLFRMISIYAALRSFGVSATAAFAGQVMLAILVLAMVCVLAHRQLPVRQSLGLTAVASLLVSPYAYDYDLPILGIGLALLMPDVLRLGSLRERVLVLGLSFVTCIIGFLQTFLRLKAPVEAMAMAGDNMALSISGLTLMGILGLTWQILRRSRSASVLQV